MLRISAQNPKKKIENEELDKLIREHYATHMFRRCGPTISMLRCTTHWNE